MKKFATIIAALHAAAEDTKDVQEEANPETFANAGAAIADSIFGHVHHDHIVPVVPVPPATILPPYPAPTKVAQHGKSPNIELIQFSGKPMDGIMRPKTKAKGGPAIPFERSALECTCPETFQLFGERCERIVEGPQETLCPQGTELLNNVCVRTVRAEERCPYGYATLNNHCVRREVTVPQMTCNAGYTLEASSGLTKHDPALVCVKQFGVENILECPDGTRYNGSCYINENVPAEFTCPPGYDDLGNATCRRIAAVPCGADKEVNTNKGLKTLAFPTLHKRQLAEEESMVMTRVPLPGHDGIKSIPVPGGALRGKGELAGYNRWHSGFKDHNVNYEIIDIEQSCVANITIPATPFCPIGELHGRLCRVPVPTPPIEVCPAYGNPTNCFAFDRLTPFATCPAGFNQECAILKQHVDNFIDCECVRIHEAPIELFCPAGYALETGVCVLRTEPYTGCGGLGRPVNGACQRTETTPAVCSYTVSYACEGPSCSTTTQHPAQKISDKTSGLLNLSLHKY